MSDIVIQENVILVRINQIYRDDISRDEIYEGTRGVWVIGNRRYNADYAFSVYKAIVKEVFKIHQWYPACTLEYKTRVIGAIKKVDISKRWEFEGIVASDEIRSKYIGKSVKHYLPSFGGANPIIYVNC
jgi:uncharacterized protein